MDKIGVYPAAVTPFDAKGRIDFEGMAKLLAWFEAQDCAGVVLAGTNGEGPSLSAPEKRDLIVKARDFKGKLDLILGIATPSLDEAIWLCKQAAVAECVAVLLMAPYYFRDASVEGIEAWFLAVMDKSPVDVIVYNFPQRTGVTISAELLERLAQHPRFAGVKDSSGAVENLAGYRAVMPVEKVLFVGNETLLIQALESGWSGSISGVANVLPFWMSQIVMQYQQGNIESACEKHKIIMPVIEALRKSPQPALNKAILVEWKVLTSSALRLPLTEGDPKTTEEILNLMERKLGPV